MKLNWSTAQELRSKGFTDQQIQDHNMVDKIIMNETTIVKICMTVPTGYGIAGSHEGSTRDYDDHYDAEWDDDR
jgi:hypothetical protein|tara:strand:- start:667 stop:888 length:222 start_codon:yes stop_codon:yes gene_type:complete